MKPATYDREHGITVVVCTRDRKTQLEKCLKQLRECASEITRIIVVDSSPRFEPASTSAEKYGALYLYEPSPGLSRARNIGARAASTRLVAFIDDDALPAEEWLQMLVPEFDDDSVGVVTGAIFSSNPNSESSKTWDALGGYSPTVKTRIVVDRNTPSWFRTAHFGELGNGSNMVFRRAVFDDWPGFNEDLGRGHRLPCGEEHYAFFELIERGYKIVYRPDGIVYHPAPSTDSELRACFLQMLTQGGMYTAYVFDHLPKYRREIYRLLCGYLSKQLLRKDSKPQNLRGIGISRFQQLMAVSTGLSYYLRTIWLRKHSPR
jgi:cellulose synthase/poly-beta-1,6-N-acetylglucosamine synthase-like glycosyltransferase